MSVICGLYSRKGFPVSAEQAQKMMAAFDGYAFDTSETWRAGQLFLGSRLQWMTPESITEQLPFYDQRSGLGITADAILDNREELLGRLAISNLERAGITDSQLILAAYRKWGEDCPECLNGDFAFAIWDRPRQRLFCARDQTGKNLFYYYAAPEVFAFATLIKPLLTLDEITKRLNETWLVDFLAIPTVATQLEPDVTPYEKIWQLLPGHKLTLTADSMKIKEYWRVKKQPSLVLKSDGEYEEAFREVLLTAVRSRLRSTGAVGLMLSGGLDSASVAGMAAQELRHRSEKLRAFTAVPISGYQDWTPAHKLADESVYVESIRKHIRNIDVVYCRAEGRNVLNITDKLFDILEQPYKNIFNMPWIDSITETAAQDYGIRVLLSGQSGNATISWGNAPLYYANLLRRLRWVTLGREFSAYHRKTGVRTYSLLKQALLANLPVYMQNWCRKLADGPPSFEKYFIANPELLTKLHFLERAAKWGSNLNNQFYHDPCVPRMRMLGVHMLGLSGCTEKKFSLAYKLAERDPTRDIRVIEFCMRVPEDQYVRDGEDRFLLRRSMAGIIPDLVRLNSTVRGTQGADWLQRIMPYWRQVDAELQTLLAVPEVAYYLNVTKLKTMLKAVKDSPESAAVPDKNYIMLVRALIFGRFVSRGRFS